MRRISNVKKGFTLIELLVTLTLVTLISLAVFSLFDSGIRVLERIAPSLAEEDVAIFLEKFSRDLQNSFFYDPLPFEGQKTALVFPALIRTIPQMGGDEGIGQVIYSYDESSGSIQRGQGNLSEIFEEKLPQAAVLLKGISSLRFQYFQWDPDDRTYVWRGEWKEEGDNKGKRPLAVKVEVVFKTQGRSRRIEKTFPIPVSGI